MRTIKKISFDGSSAVKVEYQEHTNVNDSSIINDYSVLIRQTPHEDFVNAMNALQKHVLMLCEIGGYGHPDSIPPDALSTIEVTGISIGGSDEHEGVTIIAKKRLRHNKVVNLITPFTKWEDEHNGYLHERMLYTDCNEVIAQAIEYIGGKYAPNPQLKMEFAQP